MFFFYLIYETFIYILWNQNMLNGVYICKQELFKITEAGFKKVEISVTINCTIYKLVDHFDNLFVELKR